MSEHEHEHENCEDCGGEVNAEERNEMARQMIMAMTRDIGANPDLAAKLWVMLKLAAEKVQ